MLDTARLEPLRASLGADGYEMRAAEDSGRIGITILATEDACADCLVPKNVMRAILGQVLGVPEDIIDLRYPSELPSRTCAPGTTRTLPEWGAFTRSFPQGFPGKSSLAPAPVGI